MAAGSTYTPLATTTLTVANSGITFTTISASYTDLVLVINGARSTSWDDASIKFNNDSGTNYSSTIMVGNGTSPTSQRTSNTANNGILLFGNYNSMNILHIMNYSNTTTYKTFLVRADTPANQVRANVGLWRSTAAINQIEVSTGENFIVGTTMTLYGILAA